MLTYEDYFGRVSHIEAPSAEVQVNAGVLLARVNALLSDLPPFEAVMDVRVNSGWRPASYNAGVPGAAVRSKHITGEAIDLADPDGELDEYLFQHQEVLAAHGLWLEHPAATKGWCHVQTVPPRSGNRVFFP